MCHCLLMSLGDADQRTRFSETLHRWAVAHVSKSTSEGEIAYWVRQHADTLDATGIGADERSSIIAAAARAAWAGHSD